MLSTDNAAVTASPQHYSIVRTTQLSDADLAYKRKIERALKQLPPVVSDVVTAPIVWWLLSFWVKPTTTEQVIGGVEPTAGTPVVRYSLPNGAHDVPIWLDGSTPNTSVASANVDPAYIPTADESIIQTNYRMYSYVNSSESVEQVLSVDDHYGGTTTNYVYGTARLGFEYDGKGNVADFDYDPFGVTATDSELPFFGYNGEEYNPVTGLVYLRYRYYSPELGAFIAEDDYLGEDENVNSQNRYSYCEGDPVNYADPTANKKI